MTPFKKAISHSVLKKNYTMQYFIAIFWLPSVFIVQRNGGKSYSVMTNTACRWDPAVFRRSLLRQLLRTNKALQ